MAAAFRGNVRAWVVLVAFLANLGLPLAISRDLTFDDDPACDASFATHVLSHVGLDGKELPRQHCALCHWLRAVSGARAVAGISLLPWLAPRLELIVTKPPTLHDMAPVRPGSSRAPPPTA